MAKASTSGTAKPKPKSQREKSIVTVVTAPKQGSTAYTLQRRIDELEDRVATCEAAVEHNFGETLGQLITERTRAIERQKQHYDNKTLEAVFYVGVGLLLFIGIIINNSRSERYQYSPD